MHEQTPEDSGAVRKRVRVGREPPIRPVCYGHAAHPGTVNEGSPAKRRGVVDGTFHETITVIVGSEGKLYEVHKAFLVAQSGFFEAELNDRNTKDLELVITEVEPPTFERVLAYLYSRSILKDGERYGGIAWTLLVDVYLAADHLIVSGLKNQVIDALTTKIDASENGLIPSNLLRAIFNSPATTSPLRRLAIDTYAWNLRSRMDDVDGEHDPFKDIGKNDLPSEFSVELLQQLIIKAPNLHRNRIFHPISDQYYHSKPQGQTDETP